MKYANQAYLNCIKKVGFNSIASLEDAIANVPEVYFKDLKDQIDATLKTDKIIKKDHFANNIYFHIFYKVHSKIRR